jgi:hypothetical protein
MTITEYTDGAPQDAWNNYLAQSAEYTDGAPQDAWNNYLAQSVTLSLRRRRRGGEEPGGVATSVMRILQEPRPRELPAHV